MRRRQYLDKEDQEILQWSLLPREQMEANPLPPKKQERYDRANTADNLIREHFSLRKVIERLVDKYGYSENTARRDIHLAQALWGSRNKLSKEYAGAMLWDFAVESMVRASKERKWAEVARLIKEAREIAGLGKPDAPDDDPDALARPVSTQPMFLPEAIGAKELSAQERQEIVRRVMRKKLNDGLVDRSVLAEFEDLDNDTDGDRAE